MIEIWNRDENGKDHLVKTFDTYEDMFRGLTEFDIIDAFGYSETDRTTARRYYNDWSEASDFISNTRYCYTVTDDGKFVTPDNLVGRWRTWWNNRPRRRYFWIYRKVAWGGYRGIKTTNERRQLAACLVDEDAPVVRAKRAKLPSAWDDFRAHNDKSWKTQSKRKHQWK